MKTKTSKGSSNVKTFCSLINSLVHIILLHKNCDTLYFILLRIDIFIE